MNESMVLMFGFVFAFLYAFVNVLVPVDPYAVWAGPIAFCVGCVLEFVVGCVFGFSVSMLAEIRRGWGK